MHITYKHVLHIFLLQQTFVVKQILGADIIAACADTCAELEVTIPISLQSFFFTYSHGFLTQHETRPFVMSIKLSDLNSTV